MTVKAHSRPLSQSSFGCRASNAGPPKSIIEIKSYNSNPLKSQRTSIDIAKSICRNEKNCVAATKVHLNNRAQMYADMLMLFANLLEGLQVISVVAFPHTQQTMRRPYSLIFANDLKTLQHIGQFKPLHTTIHMRRMLIWLDLLIFPSYTQLQASYHFSKKTLLVPQMCYYLKSRN
jgi:hypothetical protein